MGDGKALGRGRRAGAGDALGRGPWRALGAAIVLRAVLDFKRARPCGPGCARRGHRCKAAAEKWLEGDDCAQLLEALGMDPEAVRERLKLNGHKR